MNTKYVSKRGTRRRKQVREDLLSLAVLIGGILFIIWGMFVFAGFLW